MKVCFVGLGSIASRHIRNLKELYHDDIVIDLLRSSHNWENRHDIECIVHESYYDIDDLPQDYDVIFITNPTAKHYETLQRCHEHSKHFFIEKPVFETGLEDINKLHLNKSKQYYVACPLRYTNVIQYIKNRVNISDVYAVRCVSSSYLPDWRPGIDYRNTYSAKKVLGGGVVIDLIHEWDYLCYLFGSPERVFQMFGKKSHLEVDCEDIAVYIAEYKERIVELHLDYFGRVPNRKIELYCKNETIEADLIEQKITFKLADRVVDLKEERDSYQKKELIHFFEIINGTSMNDNTIEQACETLKIARGESK